MVRLVGCTEASVRNIRMPVLGVCWIWMIDASCKVGCGLEPQRGKDTASNKHRPPLSITSPSHTKTVREGQRHTHTATVGLGCLLCFYLSVLGYQPQTLLGHYVLIYAQAVAHAHGHWSDSIRDFLLTGRKCTSELV